jgi:hypothetical protein
MTMHRLAFITAIVAALALSAVSGRALAQAPATQLATDCAAPGAHTVMLVADATVGPGAEPGRSPEGAPVIRHDPAWWSHAPRILRRFAVLHACAHLELRHALSESQRSAAEEQAADCRALAGLRADGFEPDELTALREEMTRALGPAHGALPAGAQRAAALATACPAGPFASAAVAPVPSITPAPSEIYRTPESGVGRPAEGASPALRIDRPAGYPMPASAPPRPVNPYSAPMVYVPVGRGFLIRPQTPR